MPHELMLMRHAKSAWNTDAVSDFDRPLNKRGIKSAGKIGRFLASRALKPDMIISSSAVRAKQSVKIVLKKADWDIKPTFSRKIYGATTADLLDLIAANVFSVERLMLVGHNPSLDYLLEFLCGSDLPRTDSYKLLTTANVAIIALPHEKDLRQESSAKLIEIIRPADIG